MNSRGHVFLVITDILREESGMRVRNGVVDHEI